jgi:hypothetical protein
MAHFAEIDENNVVLRVLVVPDEEEHRGEEFLKNDLNLGGTWIQTSYNTVANRHKLGGTPLRKNFAGVGDTYNVEKDAFIEPRLYPSWTLNEDTCVWEPPVPRPDEQQLVLWDEATVSWVKA